MTTNNLIPYREKSKSLTSFTLPSNILFNALRIASNVSLFLVRPSPQRLWSVVPHHGLHPSTLVRTSKRILFSWLQKPPNNARALAPIHILILPPQCSSPPFSPVISTSLASFSSATHDSFTLFVGDYLPWTLYNRVRFWALATFWHLPLFSNWVLRRQYALLVHLSPKQCVKYYFC